jgi:tetratricopeptide (TPR) repeat protein
MPRIGLAWSGNPIHRNDRNRSIPLDTLLSGLPGGFQYVSLQKDVRNGDASTLADRPDILHFGDRLGDFSDTAALCALMDVVIAVDTSIAHLAGALGVPLWLLLPFMPDWRWLLDRDDSPWYPSARLFRQAAIGDWPSALAKVAAALTERFPDAASDERHNHAGALVNSGMLALQADDAAQALSLFGAALAADGNEAAAHCGRGNALHKLDRLEEALASYDRAIAIRPDYADAFNNRAFTLHRLDRFDAALADCDRAIALKPDYADAHSNRGMALAALGRLDEAVESYDQAIAAKPDLAEAHYNRALALQNLKRLDQARAGFQRAIAIRPGYVDALWNLSLIDLMTGNFADGWKGYERRWANAKLGHETRDFGRPLWQGERPIKGKTILLHAEQGLGDTIQFCRYAKPVAALGATVVLEAQPSLVPLLKSLNGPAQIIAKGDALPPLDLHCPLLSLPLAFDTDLGTIPAETPYLHPDDDRVAQWNRTLEGFGRPRIGLAWSGNPAHWNDGNRSIPLATLLSGLPQGFQYVSLQKDVLPGDAALLAKRTDVLHFGDRLGDFADTTALCQAMDVVISVDTSIAHLAGALGKEVWVLLPFVADWRWLLDRDDSPWYPTAHLFRQAAIGDWTGVMEHVREELGARPAPR